MKIQRYLNTRRAKGLSLVATAKKSLSGTSISYSNAEFNLIKRTARCQARRSLWQAAGDFWELCKLPTRFGPKQRMQFNP